MMKNPDVTVGVEVVQNATYVYARSVRGIGGLPVGSSGTVVSLLSSGIDSPGRAFGAWREGEPSASACSSRAPKLPTRASSSSTTSRAFLRKPAHRACVRGSFGDYQREISVSAPPSLRIILYRRLMFKVAEALARIECAGCFGDRREPRPGGVSDAREHTRDRRVGRHARVQAADRLGQARDHRSGATSRHVRDLLAGCARLLHAVHAAQP